MNATSFDSNILIDSLRGDLRARIELDSAPQRWISRVSWIELMSKVDDRTQPIVEALLDEFAIDEVDLAISRRAAELRSARPALKLPDAVILASALVNGRVLVTRNTKDFPATMPGVRIPYTISG